MGKRMRIFSLIMCTVMVLFALPVQAEATECDHVLVYSAEGNVMTETCSLGCGHEKQAALVLDTEVSLVYDGTAIEPLKVEYTEGWRGGELTIAYENNVAASTETEKASGSITKEIAGAEGAVDTVTAMETFSIAKAAMTVPVTGYTGVYDGQPHGIAVEGIPTGAVVTYSDAQDGTYSEEAPTLTNAGSTTVWYRVELENYETVSGSEKIEITPRELTVSAEAEVAYGEAAPEIQPKYEGFATVEDSSVLAGEPVLTHEYSQFMDAGSYEIQVDITGVSAANYTLAAQNGVLTVKPRELTVTWDTTTFAYDETPHKPIATVSNTVNGDEIQWTVEGEATDAGEHTAKVSITGEKIANYTLPANAEVAFTIQNAAQAAPTGLEAVQESILNIADGKITGVNADMEYKIQDAEEYTPVSGTEITGLKSGTYLVRFKAKPNYDASADTQVQVTAVKSLHITVPPEQEGYTLTVDRAEVGWKEDCKLTFALQTHYSKTDSFAVKVDGTPITLDSDGTYTIKEVQADKIITVEGIEQMITAEFAGETFTEVVNTVTFDKYMKELALTVTAPQGTTVEYSEQSAAKDPASIENWKPYTGTVTFSGAARNVICYVKATKSSGEVVYISTNGVVFDAAAPVFNIRTGVFYTTQTVTVTDANLDTVTVDGIEKTPPLTLAGNVDKNYRVVAKDRAGNESSLWINMEPFSKLDSTIKDLTTDNVESSDKGAVQTVLNKVKGLAGTAEEEALLKEIQDRCEKLLSMISIKEIPKSIEKITEDNMKPENKAAVQAVLDQVKKVNGTAEEEKLLKEIKDRCEKLLSSVNYSITTRSSGLQWSKGSKKDMEIKTDADDSTFKLLRIDGKIVATKNYTVKNGTLTLKAAYLQTLTVAKHTIEMEFEDGTTGSGTSIQILNSGTNPKTGDPAGLLLWTAAAAMSAVCLALAVSLPAGRKNRK